MTTIVCVHGIGAQMSGEQQLNQRWTPALLDGMRRAGGADEFTQTDVAIAFYGDVFRPSGRPLGLVPAGGDRIDDEFEQELLFAWWRAAAETDAAVVPPGARTLGRTPVLVSAALRALSNSAFFAKVATALLIADLRQVRRYLTEPLVRESVQKRVAAAISEDTRVLVGHSLGSVVAYEALVANPSWPVRSLVTVGSPLGTRNLIFERLTPAPVDGKGQWPCGLEHWTNVADRGDVVALVPDLRPLFGEAIRGSRIDNGARAHDVRPYLSAPETAEGILLGLDR